MTDNLARRHFGEIFLFYIVKATGPLTKDLEDNSCVYSTILSWQWPKRVLQGQSCQLFSCLPIRSNVDRSKSSKSENCEVLVASAKTVSGYLIGTSKTGKNKLTFKKGILTIKLQRPLVMNILLSVLSIDIKVPRSSRCLRVNFTMDLAWVALLASDNRAGLRQWGFQ